MNIAPKVKSNIGVGGVHKGKARRRKLALVGRQLAADKNPSERRVSAPGAVIFSLQRTKSATILSQQNIMDILR
jgi:hypothetical protein